MLMRAVGAVALGFSFALSATSIASAGQEPGLVHRVSCHVVRYYVAKYSVETAEMWARSHGATEAQIAAARRCLNGIPREQEAHWSWH